MQGELLKLFARRRTHLGFGVFLAVELLILVLWRLPLGQQWMRRAIEREGGVFEEYFSGLSVALIMLSATVFLLGGLFLALVGGDMVAKEVEDGTMRMTLCRPVSRLRVLGIKYAACVVYTFVLVGFIGLTALCGAWLCLGGGGLFAAFPAQGIMAFYGLGEGLWRYLAALPCLGLSLLTLTTFAFQFSCWRVKPATATIAALTVFFVDWILHLLPYFESYRRWMITSHMSVWIDLFRAPVPWPKMVEEYAYLLGLDASFLIVGVAVFCARDFKA